jgi:hypothetical protein
MGIAAFRSRRARDGTRAVRGAAAPIAQMHHSPRPDAVRRDDASRRSERRRRMAHDGLT